MLPETREVYELEKLWTLRSYDEQLKSIPTETLPEDFIFDVEVTKWKHLRLNNKMCPDWTTLSFGYILYSQNQICWISKSTLSDRNAEAQLTSIYWSQIY